MRLAPGLDVQLQEGVGFLDSPQQLLISVRGTKVTAAGVRRFHESDRRRSDTNNWFARVASDFSEEQLDHESWKDDP